MRASENNLNRDGISRLATVLADNLRHMPALPAVERGYVHSGGRTIMVTITVALRDDPSHGAKA